MRVTALTHDAEDSTCVPATAVAPPRGDKDGGENFAMNLSDEKLIKGYARNFHAT